MESRVVMQKQTLQCLFNTNFVLNTFFLCVFVCLSVFSFPLQAAIDRNIQYRFINLSIRDGLPDSRIVEIYRQKNGLMWFATPSGAVSYSGERFSTYSTRSTPAIIGNKVTSITEDNFGDIWISTTDGVSRIHNSIVSQNYSTTNQEDYWSNHLYHDSLGGVWSSNNEGLAKLNANQEFEYVAFHQGETKAYVASVTEYNNRLYISTTEGIFKLDYQTPDAEPEYITQGGILVGMFNSQDGNIWYTRYNDSGVYRFNIESETLTLVPVPGFEDVHYSGVTVHQDSLVLASFSEGLVVYSLATQEVFKIRHSAKHFDNILSNEVLAVLVDESGILWSGTPKGISYYSFLKQGSYINQLDAVISTDAKIFQTVGLHDGDVLVTSEDGVAVFNQQLKTISDSSVDGLNGVRVYSTSVSADHSTYWFAHDGGISHFDAVSGTTTSFGEQYNNQFPLPGRVFYTITGLNDKEALVSSQLGGPIFKFHKEKGIIAKYLDDGSNLYAVTKSFCYASIVSQGQLWLASTVGLINIKLDTGEYHILRPTPQAKKTEFVDVAVDIHGTVWAASTDHGLLTAVPSGTDVPYQLVSVPGLESKQISNVVAENSVLWLSTKTDILKYDTDTQAITEFPNLLNDWELRFIPNSMSISNGDLMVGSSTGLISVNTRVIRANTFRPNTIFTDIKSGDVSLNNLINQTNVELPYDLHNLKFSFASLDYHVSDRLSYQYRLTGFDETWVQTRQNHVNYTNLPWGHYTFEVQGSNSDGMWSNKVIKFEFTIRPAWWFYVIICLAVTTVCFLALAFYSRQKRIKQLHRAAHRDALTGIGNRAQFNEALQQYLERDKPFALILFDIQNLKHVNDSKGYWLGDVLIQKVAERLVDCLSKPEECARVGGGKFAVLTRDYKTQSSLEQYVSELLTTLLGEYKVDQDTLRCAFSIGVNQYPQGGENAIQLHKNCDLAFFKSKQKELNSVVFFDKQLEIDLRYLMGINQDLNHVIENEELYVVYQPKMKLDTLQITGAEALVRWLHPTHGVISPAVFIEQAEANGTIVEIGYWILSAVCQQAIEWRNLGLSFGRIAVNISPIQLQRSDFVNRVVSIIDDYDLPYNLFEFEITESVLLGNVRGIVDVLNTLRQKGISIALDDFGTGYSSLSYLTRLPLDTLKIDKSLIDDITTHSQHQAIFSSTTRLAHELNLLVVVEGIETQAQLDVISNYPCAFGQGYFFSKPLTKGDFESMMQSSYYA